MNDNEVTSIRYRSVLTVKRMIKAAFASVALLLAVPVLTSTIVSAADLPTRKAPVAPPVIAPQANNWTGFYLGGNVGGAWHSANWFEDATTSGSGGLSPPGFQDAATHATGVVGGIQGGFDYQFNSFVLGAAADVDASGVRGSSTCFQAVGGTTQSCSTEQDLFGTVTGRVGYAFDRVLFYGLGGFAWEHEKLQNPCTGSCGNLGLANTNWVYSGNSVGWTVGGGVEYALTKNISIFGQYNYMNFGNRNYSFIGIPAGTGNYTENVKQREDVVKVGLNWRFN